MKKIITILGAILIATQMAIAAPLPALFYASSFEVNVGDTVTFDLKVNPAPTSPVYTVGATLKYDPSILTFSDASTDKAWLPLSRSPYEITDSSKGIITRTAGYPEGLKATASFTHYVFRATAPGETKVVISEGMALDAENNDSGLQAKTITIKVKGPTATVTTPDNTAAPVATPSTTSKKNVPQTVTLEITGQNAFYADTAYDFAISHKFKVAQNTTGTTSYSVFNQEGAEVYTSQLTFASATDTSIAFQIPANTIQAGDYTIVATSKYSDQKSPTSAKKDLGVLARADNVVEKTVEVPTIPFYVYIGGGILLLILILMIMYNRSKGFRKFLKNF